MKNIKYLFFASFAFPFSVMNLVPHFDWIVSNWYVIPQIVSDFPFVGVIGSETNVFENGGRHRFTEENSSKSRRWEKDKIVDKKIKHTIFIFFDQRINVYQL